MTIHVKESADELAQLYARNTAQFALRILDLARAAFTGIDTTQEQAALAELLGDTMALADLYGRRRLLLEADAARQKEVKASVTPVVPHVEFDEAIEDLIRREPRLADSAEEVSKAYRTRHAFALARSADIVVTRRVQEFLVTALKEGRTVTEAKEVIAGLGDFSQAYASTIFRTNLSTAYTAGRFRQAADPDVADVFAGFEYVAILDGSVRPNHAAAHGLVAAANDPIWQRFAPPLGYNERCSVRIITTFEAKERRLLDRDGRLKRWTPATFSAARPDAGFGGGRPDIRIYMGR